MHTHTQQQQQRQQQCTGSEDRDAVARVGKEVVVEGEENNGVEKQPVRRQHVPQIVRVVKVKQNALLVEVPGACWGEVEV